MINEIAYSLACPDCREALVHERGGLRCLKCSTLYVVRDGAPLLAPRTSNAAKTQASWFDAAVAAEFEIERPRSCPRLYASLLAEKFKRSVEGLELAGLTALAVCGGSGMDAELLAQAGAKVVSSDISPGAAVRAVERARRHGTKFDSIVADIERLPFADRSVDLVYVHDGLHHIEDPLAGLREMARVSRWAICVTEPADALVTSLAVKVGLALDREEAGNRVARLRSEEVQRTLEAEGFRIIRASRYAMFYRHEPGRMMRVLSRPALLPFAKIGLALVNAVLGRAGNKLVVQAVRR